MRFLAKANIGGQFILSVVLLFGTASAYAALPELPRVYVDTTMPSTSVTKTVCASGCDYTNDKLQQAIDDAQLGTTITLQPGVTYTPSGDLGFILKNKTSGSGWIIIKSANTDSALPLPGTRLTPDYASVMPKIARSTFGLYALFCELTAHHYRIIGVEFMNTGNADTRILGSAFVACNSILETSLAMQSHHILFDRVYIHGPSAGGSVGVKFGIVFGGQHEGVIDSTIEDITYGSDAITVISWAGAGPFVIKNNALSSSGENIFFGGSYATVPNLTPSDIEIRNNYVYKPLKWRDDPAYNSGPNKILVKNLLEHKNAQRVLIDGNVFENMWPSAQPGFALTFTPRQGGSLDLNPWTTVQDVTVTNNLIKSTANGIAISGRDTGVQAFSGGGAATMLGGRYLVKNNLFINSGGYPGTGIMFQLGNGAFDVTIQHNTVASYAPNTGGTTLSFLYGPGNGDFDPMQRFVLQDNIFQARNYPFFEVGGCVASNLSQALPGFVWTQNVFAGPWPTPAGCDSSVSPQGNGNAYPAGESSIGYVNPAGVNYSLGTGSPYKNAASDGKDIGVNWPALTVAQVTSTTTSSTSTPAPTPPAAAPTPPASAPTTPAPAPTPTAPALKLPAPAPTTTVPAPTPSAPALKPPASAPTPTVPAQRTTAQASMATVSAPTSTASASTTTASAPTTTAPAPMTTTPAPPPISSAPAPTTSAASNGNSAEPTVPAPMTTASVPTTTTPAPPLILSASAPTTSAALSGNSAEPKCSQKQRKRWWQIWKRFQRCG